MSTILFTVLIFLAGQGLRSYLKGKGSCGDCECSCPIKDEMHQSHRHQQRIGVYQKSET